ncbi:nitrogen regulation protein NR(I) [Achromobacter marplatensis]|jgi:two-component system nitrogen regulation response regulator GlnG|uniref:DNA-binding transcriptional regulator NtrC n=2 Tax=Achromobacter marplatensis TaxID=470868 RepID=J4PIK7_9BURK|nr:nitrogen regulation protein NR(I) [Achromobacter marplatensis]EJO33637.1 nitrogen regulation protein NR(I) [Achromobacter marplatensis]MDH2050015.1 nitrogen regulation protein NR(I) [Achromobacter marplatensis]OWT72290.1 nitrogen regulation protein NR(I) [Achromobacter marplatensis]RBP24425.1 two-component system nitrogen regulation response regulator GlnG [Achromobacter marplatensis]CAB3626741.1 DNA-binding transcriptional regulator NtrC [Achromobacter marplatensis]
MKPVWIVDDDQAIRWVLEKALARAGVPTRSFSQSADVLEALSRETPVALVSDIRMPGGNGLELLRQLKERHPGLPVIVMTAFADLDSTVSAFQGGAFDYLAKPFDVNEAVALIQRAMQESTQPETPEGQGEAAQNNERWMMTQSSSTAMQEVFRAIGRLAQSKVTVLITGESGTGKELVARALHGHGVRASGPFVALNAAAIPRDLLEAELFGHERGAFTGANNLRRGRFEEAHGGTLFLDEIGDMPIELQTRLLRVLAEGSFYRVGGAQPVRVDVRIVAATHQPLEQRVEQGLFREDLFHRLNVIRLRLPPLRERVEDIPALAQHFLTASARTLGVPVKRLTPDALAVLTKFDFPGNVRQLENFCHWLTVMAPGQTVDRQDLPPEIRALEHQQQPGLAPLRPATPMPGIGTVVQASQGLDDGAPRNWQDSLLRDAQYRLERGEPAVMATLTRQFEKILLQSALDASRGRRVEAASRLGIGRNTITRKLRELGIEDE